jgi:hypothetical protein
MLFLLGGDTGNNAATWGTADTSSGNVVVVGTGLAATTFLTDSFVSVFGRCSTSALTFGTSNYYEARMDFTGSQALLIAQVGATPTTLATVSSVSFSADEWYQVALSCNGSAISATFQRVSDGFWLTSGGVWQAGAATAISVTDSSVTGSGFAGYVLHTDLSNDVYADNWTLFAIGTSISATESGDAFSGSASSLTNTTLSATERTDSFAGSGNFTAPAAMASTEAHDTLAASGHFAAAGAMAATAGSDSLAGAAHFTAPGVLGPTETHDAFAGSAAAPIFASLAPAEGRDVFASGSLDILGSLELTAGGDIFAAAGATDDVGALAPTERRDVMSSFALVSPALHAREGGDIFAGSGTSTGMTATLSGTGAGDTFSAGGGFSFDTRGQLVGLEAQDLFAWLATQSSSAALNAVESGDRLAATSVVGSTGTLDAAESGDSFAGGQVVVQYHVYANTGIGDPINYDSPIAATTATTFTTSPLSFPGTWSFAVRAFDVFGEEQNLDCALSIVLNTTGQDITNQPLPPTAIRAFALVGGDIRVEWFYPPTTGPRAPTGFHVYAGTGGVPNYATPVATVLFSAGFGSAFQVDVTGFIGGGVYTIGVRAFNATAEEQNTNTVVVTAIATGPTAVIGLTAAATATA